MAVLRGSFGASDLSSDTPPPPSSPKASSQGGCTITPLRPRPRADASNDRGCAWLRRWRCALWLGTFASGVGAALLAWHFGPVVQGAPPVMLSIGGGATAPEPLIFSDGTRVVKRRGARLVAVRQQPPAVALRLDEGTVVVEPAGEAFRLQAGPAELSGQGRFQVEVQAAARRIEVQVQAGRAVVRGAEIPGGGKTLGPGEGWSFTRP